MHNRENSFIVNQIYMDVRYTVFYFELIPEYILAEADLYQMQDMHLNMKYFQPLLF